MFCTFKIYDFSIDWVLLDFFGFVTIGYSINQRINYFDESFPEKNIRFENVPKLLTEFKEMGSRKNKKESFPTGTW